MAITELNDQNYQSTLAQTDVALVDIYASWCGSCRLFAPHFEEAAKTHPEFQFFKIEAEANPTFRATIPVDNLPYVAVFHQGNFVGGQSTSKKEGLEEMIQVIKEKTRT